MGLVEKANIKPLTVHQKVTNVYPSVSLINDLKKVKNVKKEMRFEVVLMSSLIVGDCFYVSAKKSLQIGRLIMQVVKEDVVSEFKTSIPVCFKNNKQAGVFQFPEDLKILKII